MTDRLIEIGVAGGPYYEYKKQSGVNTPLHLRTQGRFTNNPYTMEQIYQLNPTIEPMFYTDWGAGYPVPPNSRAFSSWFQVQSSWGSPVSNASVIADLSAKWRDGPVDLGMYFSPEGRESLLMVGSTLEKLIRGTNALRKGNFGGFLSEIRPVPPSHRRSSYEKFTQGDLSGSFLAAHLGWTPLIQDIYNAPDCFRGAEYQSESVKVRKGHTGNYCKFASPRPKLSLINNGCFGVTGLNAKFRRPPAFAERFGLDNPFRIAWELVPLSFVADYFLPIGDTIEALAFIGRNIASETAWTSYVQLDYVVRGGPKSLAINNNSTLYYNRESYTYTLMHKKSSRTPQAITLADCLDWKLKIPKSAMKLSTMAALLHQNILNFSKR